MDGSPLCVWGGASVWRGSTRRVSAGASGSTGAEWWVCSVRGVAEFRREVRAGVFMDGGGGENGGVGPFFD